MAFSGRDPSAVGQAEVSLCRRCVAQVKRGAGIATIGVGLLWDPKLINASQGEGRSQGLTHAFSLPIVGRDASVDNPEVLEALKLGADVSNIFDAFPTNIDAANRAEYSPAWDLNVGVYSDAAVAAGRNGLQTDADEIRQLAAAEVGGSPGRLPLGSANIVINCPALALLDKPVER